MKPLPMSLSYLMIVLQLTIVQMLLVDYSDDIGRSVDDSVNSDELRLRANALNDLMREHCTHLTCLAFPVSQTSN